MGKGGGLSRPCLRVSWRLLAGCGGERKLDQVDAGSGPAEQIFATCPGKTLLSSLASECLSFIPAFRCPI